MTNSEIIVNLWYIVDKSTGLISTIAGRAYHATGSDDDKTALLKRLAVCDYPLATRCFVADRFKVDDFEGFTTLDELNNPETTLFEEVYTALEQDLAYITTIAPSESLKIPEKPLYVMTSLVEEADGTLRPVV